MFSTAHKTLISKTWKRLLVSLLLVLLSLLPCISNSVKFKDMKNNLIHVALPHSFVDKMNANVLDVADALSVAYNGKKVSFQVDILPDEFFNSSIVWLTSK